MTILEITLNNPIGRDEIKQLIAKISTSQTSEYLSIDTGEHDFVSVDVIKYFNQQMYAHKVALSRYKKIALIHPPEIKNESSNLEVYRYFTTINEAKDWFSIKC